MARAVALALREQPELNARVRFWGRIEQRKDVDVFVSVATDGGRDLSGVRIERADEKSLVEVAREVTGRARGIRTGEDATYRESRSMFQKMPSWLARPRRG